MATPLNLTLKHGPSVWDDHRHWRPDWRAFSVAGGAMLASMALHPRVRGRWVLGLGLGVVGTCLLAGRFLSMANAGRRQLHALPGVRKDHVVDRASEDSFPA